MRGWTDWYASRSCRVGNVVVGLEARDVVPEKELSDQ